MNLIIDLGNTRTKLAFFDGDDLVSSLTYKDPKDIAWDTVRQNGVTRILTSSVRDNPVEIPPDLNTLSLEFTNSCHLPVRIDYTTPETLGTDRIANAVAANFLFPDTNCLILDAGTCLKCDFISADGVYSGGSISPGLEMRCHALEHYTGKLPVIKPSLPDYYKGKSTYESLNSGVVNGMIAEINGFIGQYSDEFDDLLVIGTGGDIDFFADAIKSPIFAHNFLTLLGLNRILQYN